MGDRDLEKNMENPDTVQKVCGGPWLHQTERTVLVIALRLCPRDTSLDLADHNQTANLDTCQLCGWFESHHRLGGWSKRLCPIHNDWLSQDKYMVCLSQGPRPDQVRKSVGPLSLTSWSGDSIRNVPGPRYRVPRDRSQGPPPTPRNGKFPIRRTFHISEYGRLPPTPT
ncbi:hypothetical protein F2Q69_00021616 [Brassica cretica]|uniref:Uncharacterized protein n=1 Tax=Brassica cretica TaxID=69181 RepID=A0A8S9QDT7_BRACR|nr:hypothetical protein F2Q69_00021616 [Brassica cretica]